MRISLSMTLIFHFLFRPIGHHPHPNSYFLRPFQFFLFWKSWCVLYSQIFSNSCWEWTIEVHHGRRLSWYCLTQKLMLTKVVLKNRDQTGSDTNHDHSKDLLYHKLAKIRVGPFTCKMIWKNGYRKRPIPKVESGRCSSESSRCFRRKIARHPQPSTYPFRYFE